MKLLFLGDVMLGRLVNEVLERESFSYPWGNTLKVIEKTDWRTCNLECVLAEDGTLWTDTPKAFHFRSDAKNTAVLTVAGIDAVTLANNHVIDYGFDGMLEMLINLDEAGIGHAGVGADLAQATEVTLQNVKGKRIALLSCTDNEPYWQATDEDAGTFYVPVDLEDERAIRLMEVIAWNKKRVDILCVGIHWGGNWGEKVPEEHKVFARRMIDSGADIIFGHSPHVTRGIEIYNGKPIMYSTGDFIDDYAVDEVEKNDQSFIFTVETDGLEVKQLVLYPTVIRGFQALLAEDIEAREISQRMQKLSAELGTVAEWLDEERCLMIKVRK